MQSLLAPCLAALNVLPRSYWRFENATDLSQDERGVQALTRWEGIGAKGNETMLWRAQTDGGIVGHYVDWTGQRQNSSSAAYWEAKMGSVPLNQTGATTASGVTIELLVKPGTCFGRGGQYGFFAAFPPAAGKACSATISREKIDWRVDTIAGPHASGGTPVDYLTAPFEGTGVLAADALSDGAWHHFAFVKDAQSGRQSIWIDGQQAAATLGNATGRVLATSNIYFNSRGALTTCAGIDEVAIYEQALPDSLIFQHFLDARAHRPYSPTDPGGSPPAPTPQAHEYDLKEFAPNTKLPTPDGNATMGVTVTPIEQLRAFADPRFASPLRLRANFNWMDPGYMGGMGQPGLPRANVTNNSMMLQDELSSRWNYAIALSGHSCCSKAQNRTIALANAHPERHLTVIIMRAEEPDMSLRNQSLPDGCYLQKARQFIDCRGTVVKAPHKVLRPTTPELAATIGCPDTVFAHDGAYLRDNVFRKLDLKLTRPIDTINEDGEIFVSLGQNGKCAADPLVAGAFATFNASMGGAGTWETYASLWRVRLTTYYRDQFLKATPPIRALSTSHYSEYQVQGSTVYFGNWTYTRQIGTPYTQPDGTTQYYSTSDFYPRHPKWWATGAGAWHGLSWMELVRASEMANGDPLFSPFVAAGWSKAAEANIRPAQWLGLVKILGCWGAEWYYAGFFSLSAPFPRPENWVWQAAVPVYAQAVTSLYSEVLFDGAVMDADGRTAYSAAGGSLLWAGALNRVAIARKHKTKETYVLAAAIMRQSNVKGNSLLETNATVGVPGTNLSLELSIRLQGSVYVLDRSCGDGAERFVQLDGWHEASHPSFWSREVHVEAELAHLMHKPAASAQVGSLCSVSTEREPGSVAGDYRRFTSYMTVASGEQPLVYPLGSHALAAGQCFVWLRVRHPTHSGVGGVLSIALSTHSGVHGSRWVGVALTAQVAAGNAEGWRWERVAMHGSTKVGAGSAAALHIRSDKGDVDVDRLVVTADDDYKP